MKKLIALFFVMLMTSLAKADVVYHKYNYTHGLLSLGTALISIILLLSYIRYRKDKEAISPSFLKFLLILWIISFILLFIVPAYYEHGHGR